MLYSMLRTMKDFGWFKTSKWSVEQLRFFSKFTQERQQLFALHTLEKTVKALSWVISFSKLGSEKCCLTVETFLEVVSRVNQSGQPGLGTKSVRKVNLT